MGIDKIVNDAIPYDTCPRKEADNKNRREQLKNRIDQLLTERDKSKPYEPELEYKNK